MFYLWAMSVLYFFKYLVWIKSQQSCTWECSGWGIQTYTQKLKGQVVRQRQALFLTKLNFTLAPETKITLSLQVSNQNLMQSHDLFDTLIFSSNVSNMRKILLVFLCPNSSLKEERIPPFHRNLRRTNPTGKGKRFKELHFSQWKHRETTKLQQEAPGVEL